MLLSLVVALTPTESFTVRGFYGRHARAWFLQEVSRHEPELARALHGGSGPRPYTVSSLWCPRQQMAPSDVCYLRLTSVAGPLSALLQGPFLESLPDEIRIRDARLKPLGRAAWHPWDAESSFEGLMVATGQPGLSAQATLHFASPTAFRSQGSDRPLPVPALVWRSLYHQWQTFAPLPARVDESWVRFAATGLAVSDFAVQSQKVIFKRGSQGAATGATGYVTYRLLPAHLCGAYGELRPGAEATLILLGAFALFCGVGHHTAIGLGQSRTVADPSEADARVMTPRYQDVKMG